MPEPITTKQRVSKYWRSLDELENSPEFQEFVHREFPQAASELPQGISRRRWMQLMGASFALAGAQGCRWQTEKFAAFAERPEGYVPGSHTKFATSVELGGSTKHLLVTCYDGRPIKVDGNPEHPASGGATDCFAQAATLSLYDPDRQSTVWERTDREKFSRTWADFEGFARETATRMVEASGEGLSILMQPTSSLAVKAGLANLLEKFPKAKLFEYAPLSRRNELAGADVAFGKPVRTRYQLENAEVIACFDADLLAEFPESTRMAREYAERREPDGEKNSAGMNRLYAVENRFTQTGAVAEHRLAVKASAIPALLATVRDAIAARVAGEAPDPPAAADGEEAAPYQEAFVYALAEDLAAAKGKSVVAVGPRQPAESHAIAHEINALLENAGETVVYIEEPEPVAEDISSLADLLGEIAAKRVDTLLILGGNPVYDAPADFDVVELVSKVPHSIHLSQYDDETSRICHWSLPETHPFEAWGDAAAWDGTVSVGQPLIEPLLGGRSMIQVLSLLADGPGADPQQLVRDAVGATIDGLDENAWKKLLHDGHMPSAAPPTDAELVRTGFEVSGNDGASEGEAVSEESDALELVFTASSHTYDGRFANNGWLQETPDFITKLTWDNAALVAPATAKELGVGQGELLQVGYKVAGKTYQQDLPVFLQPGHAEGSISIALGYGRTAAGRVGGMVYEDGSKASREFVVGLRGNWGELVPLIAPAADPVGVNSYLLRTSDAMDIVKGVDVKPTGKPYLLAGVQDHHAIDELGLEETVRRSGELIREATHETYEENPEFAKHVGAHVPDVELWNELAYEDNRAWGMAIDLNKCIGCNACMVACQAENNVPVVGKDQVARGREMHWIRIDRYFTGKEVEDEQGEKAIDYTNPRIAYQPLTCQHCETAPCEQVCPVAATTHSDEGLNDMAYNRCIGTRYCANNCPFKVRRFNFFNYTHRFEQASNELMRLVMNPEVTVRGRGVMEKCTYCVQRIAAGRIEAKNEKRAVRDGDIVTACQEACPTTAIAFGDLNDKESQVGAWHKSERAYTLLDGLRLKPRTKYLARVLNPNKRLEPYLALPTKINEDHGHGEGHGHDDGHGEGDHGEGHDEGHGEGESHANGSHNTRPRSRNRLGDLPIIG